MKTMSDAENENYGTFTNIGLAKLKKTSSYSSKKLINKSEGRVRTENSPKSRISRTLAPLESNSATVF